MKIIIYGYGKCGKAYEKYVKEWKLAEIVAITDKKYESISDEKQDSLFISINECQEVEYDYIVITPIGYENEIRNELIQKDFNNDKIKEIFNFDITRENQAKDKYCISCNKDVVDFMEMGQENNIFTKKRIIGGGIRKGRCPSCGSTDRERFLQYVLNTFSDLFSEDTKKILHFAPEKMLSDKIRRKNLYGKYITADIVEGRADVVADIRELQFSNEEFDFIICNHVLEHVDREKDALCELWRVLKYDGMLICSVPICWEEDTIEDNGIVDEDERLNFYGQKDHVRLYGKDFAKRLEGIGFEVTCYKSDDICHMSYIEKNGFILGDACFMGKKIDTKNKLV